VALINFCLLHGFDGMRDGVSQREAAAELDLSRNFLQTLLKDREKILERSASETQANIKRKRTGKDGEVEDALMEWYEFAKRRRVPLSGPTLCQKAEDLAWSRVTELAITNSWRKGGFVNAGGAEGDRQDEEAELEEVAEVAPPQGLTQEEFNAWVNIDEEVEVFQELTNEDFTASLVENLVAGPQNEEEEADGDDDEANEPPPKVTTADM